MRIAAVRIGAAAVLLALVAACGTEPGRTTVLTAASEPVVVTLGDSVPAGTACACDPFPVLYARSQHAASRNLAVPGATSADVLGALPSLRDAVAGADRVLLMVGANDMAAAFDEHAPYAAAAATVQANVTGTITGIERIRAVPVVVLGYWNVVRDGRVGEASYGADGMRNSAAATAAANDALRAAAVATGSIFVPTGTAFHGADGSADPTPLLAADGDHPDARGHAAIAALLPPLQAS